MSNMDISNGHLGVRGAIRADVNKLEAGRSNLIKLRQ